MEDWLEKSGEEHAGDGGELRPPSPSSKSKAKDKTLNTKTKEVGE